MSVRDEWWAGVRSVAPMLVAVIPFGLIVGATPATNGLGGGAAIGFSTLVFAGASQLTAIDSLADGASALVAILAACTVNLRLMLYSASLAPAVADVPLRKRLLMGYVLTDQAYAVSISRWTEEDRSASEGGPPVSMDHRLAFYFGAALTLWVNWQICTIVGIFVGSAVPDSLPLDFTVPLVFLVLLVPAVTTRPALVAAAVGGAVALLAAEVGPAHSEVLFGALAGIAAGAWAEARIERRGARDDTPLPPDPGPAP